MATTPGKRPSNIRPPRHWHARETLFAKKRRTLFCPIWATSFVSGSSNAWQFRVKTLCLLAVEFSPPPTPFFLMQTLVVLRIGRASLPQHDELFRLPLAGQAKQNRWILLLLPLYRSTTYVSGVAQRLAIVLCSGLGGCSPFVFPHGGAFGSSGRRVSFFRLHFRVVLGACWSGINKQAGRQTTDRLR